MKAWVGDSEKILKILKIRGIRSIAGFLLYCGNSSSGGGVILSKMGSTMFNYTRWSQNALPLLANFVLPTICTLLWLNKMPHGAVAWSRGKTDQTSPRRPPWQRRDMDQGSIDLK